MKLIQLTRDQEAKVIKEFDSFCDRIEGYKGLRWNTMHYIHGVDCDHDKKVCVFDRCEIAEAKKRKYQEANQ